MNDSTDRVLVTLLHRDLQGYEDAHPSLSLTIYTGEGGGGGALGFPRGGAAAIGETLDGFWRPHPLGNLPPKPGGAAALGVAPHLSWLREMGWEGRSAP